MPDYYTPPVPVVNGNVAFAKDVNDVSEKVDTAFELVDADIQAVGPLVSVYSDLAQKWAEEAFNVEVLPGQYSALHWSNTSKNHAANALAWSDTAYGHALQAEVHEIKTESFVSQANDYRDQALSYADQAAVSFNGAQDAATDAQSHASTSYQFSLDSLAHSEDAEGYAIDAASGLLSEINEIIDHTLVPTDTFIYDTTLDSIDWREKTKDSSWAPLTFPSYAGIVAFSDQVHIYDLSDTNASLWMVFSTGAPTSVAMENGVLAIGDASAGLRVVDFKNDTCKVYNTTGQAYTTNIANRDTVVTPTFSGDGIADNSINSVAIHNGIIAVGTQTVLSVIDGDTVYDAGANWETNEVSFQPNGDLVRSLTGTSGATRVYSDYLTAAFPWERRYEDSNNHYLPFTLPAPSCAVAMEDGEIAVGSTEGLTLIKENPQAPLEGMSNHITSTYQSGWMAHDCKGAFLSNTVAETIGDVGTNLVTNGDMWYGASGSTPPTGWTQSDSLVQYSTSDRVLTINRNGAGGTDTQQTIATVVDQYYTIKIRVVDNSAGTVAISAGGSILYNWTATGDIYLNFKATSTSTVIGVRPSQSSTQVIQIGELSVAPTDFGITYNNTVHDLTAQTTLVEGMLADDDGTFLVARADGTVLRYTSAWVFYNIAIDLRPTETNIQDIIRVGDYYYVVGIVSQKIYQCDLSGVYTGFSWSTTAETTLPVGITYDGSHFWVLGASPFVVYRYTDAGVYTGSSYTFTPPETSPRAINYRDGYFYVTGLSTQALHRYTFNWSYIGVALYTDQSFPSGLSFTGETLYMSDRLDDSAYEYDISSWGRESLGYEESSGPELISDTNFTTGCGVNWTCLTGWSIASGVASCDGTQTSTSNLYESISVEPDKVYKVTIKVDSVTAGSVALSFGSVSTASITTPGTYVRSITGGDGILRVAADSSFIGEVSHVSVKACNGAEMLPSPGFSSECGVDYTCGVGITLTGSSAIWSGIQTGYSSAVPIGVKLQPGKLYKVVTNITSRTAGGFIVSTTSGFTAPGVTPLYTAAGVYTDYIDGGDGTIRLAGNADFAGTVDSVSITQVNTDDDRSLEENNLILQGQLTKTQVNTGSELVAYSGFDKDNHLWSPYNSDYDFGTGDFYISGWHKVTSATTQVILDRRTGGTVGFQLYLSSGAYVVVIGATTVATGIYATLDQWEHFTMVRESGVCYLYVNGQEAYSAAAANNVDATQSMFMGISFVYSAPNTSSLALVRLGSGAPTANQINYIYNKEKSMFLENAKCTSGSVDFLDYDSKTGEVIAVSAGQEISKFKGSQRISEESSSFTKLSQEGTRSIGGDTATLKAYVPEINLRDPDKTKDTTLVPHTSTGAGQTSIAIPEGYYPVTLYDSGLFETFTIEYDGFIYYAIIPASTGDVTVMIRRV